MNAPRRSAVAEDLPVCGGGRHDLDHTSIAQSSAIPTLWTWALLLAGEEETITPSTDPRKNGAGRARTVDPGWDEAIVVEVVERIGVSAT
jgi:hypothetical protein